MGRERTITLDILRAFAILLVIFHHTGLRLSPSQWDVLANVLVNSGWAGVDLFFAISGFLIVSMMQAPDYDAGRFFRKRVFRIAPLYVVAVAVFALASIVMKQMDGFGAIWSPALMLNGWTIPFYGERNVPYTITWSLSVEETAYLVLGLAAIFGNRSLKSVVICLVVASPVIRGAIIQADLFNPQATYYFVPARLDAVAFGGLAALGLLNRPSRASAGIAGALVVALLLGFAFVQRGNPAFVLFGYSALAYCAAMLVAGLVHCETASSENSTFGTLLANPLAGTLAEFGRVSYFIYLFHLYAVEAAVRTLGRLLPGSAGFWLCAGIAAVSTFFLARLSWRWFEAPMIVRGRRETWKDAIFGRYVAA